MVKKIKEVLDKTRTWLKTYKKQILLPCIAAAAFMAAAGALLCALRPAAFSADQAVTAENAVSVMSGPDKPEEEQRILHADEKPEETGTSVSRKGLEETETPVPQKGSEETETPVPQKGSEETEASGSQRERRRVPESGKSDSPAHQQGTDPAGTGTVRDEPNPEQTVEILQQSAQESRGITAAQEESPGENAAHEHNWIPVTATVHRDAVTHTVHHDAVTDIVHHEPVTHEEPVYEYRTICNTCGEDITGHIPDHIGPVCQGSYSVQQIQTGVNIVTDREAYDEEVITENARDEIVIDQEARDEVITVGWRCSVCGERKE